MNHSTATCWKNTHKIVKRRWLWTCPRTGCTVTHHSILWVGLFILHFPQLLRRSAVYSAQDIKPTAGNQNRRKVRIGVAKLGLQYQRTWKAASRNTASFSFLQTMPHDISWADHTVPWCLPSFLFTHENSVRVLQPTDSCSHKIQFSTCYSRNCYSSRQQPRQEHMAAEWEERTAAVKTGSLEIFRDSSPTDSWSLLNYSLICS